MEKLFDSFEDSISRRFSNQNNSVSLNDWDAIQNKLDAIENPEKDNFEELIASKLSNHTQPITESIWSAIESETLVKQGSKFEWMLKNAFTNYTLPVSKADWRAILMIMPWGKLGFTRQSAILAMVSLFTIASFLTVLINLSDGKKDNLAKKLQKKENKSAPVVQNNSKIEEFSPLNDKFISLENNNSNITTESTDKLIENNHSFKTNSLSNIVFIPVDKNQKKSIFTKDINQPISKIDKNFTNTELLIHTINTNTLENLDWKKRPLQYNLPIIKNIEYYPTLLTRSTLGYYARIGFGINSGTQSNLNNIYKNSYQSPEFNARSAFLQFNLGVSKYISNSIALTAGISVEQPLKALNSAVPIKIRIPENFIEYINPDGSIQFRQARSWRDSTIVIKNTALNSSINIPIAISKNWNLNKRKGLKLHSRVSGSLGINTGNSGQIVNPYLHEDASYWKANNNLNTKNTLTVSDLTLINKTKKQIGLGLGIEKNTLNTTHLMDIQINKQLNNTYSTNFGMEYRPVSVMINYTLTYKLF